MDMKKLQCVYNTEVILFSSTDVVNEVMCTHTADRQTDRHTSTHKHTHSYLTIQSSTVLSSVLSPVLHPIFEKANSKPRTLCVTV